MPIGIPFVSVHVCARVKESCARARACVCVCERASDRDREIEYVFFFFFNIRYECLENGPPPIEKGYGLISIKSVSVSVSVTASGANVLFYCQMSG